MLKSIIKKEVRHVIFTSEKMQINLSAPRAHFPCFITIVDLNIKWSAIIFLYLQFSRIIRWNNLSFSAMS